MDIKPIETPYKGYRMRSRLEARWACFFGALGMKWEYEKEGYRLGNMLYLPDFWLPFLPQWDGHHPGAGAFLEVKGVYPTHDEIRKMQQVSMCTMHNGIIVWGLPGENSFISTHRSGNIKVHNGGEDFYVNKRELSVTQLEFLYHIERCFPDFSFISNAVDAFQAARSARFEHGESGAG